MVAAANDLKAEVAAVAAPGVEANLTGAAGMWSDFNEANRDAMLKSELISWPVTLAILVLAFGSLVAAGLPLMLTIVGLIASAGVLYLGTLLSPISIWAMNFALMFALALGHRLRPLHRHALPQRALRPGPRSGRGGRRDDGHRRQGGPLLRPDRADLALGGDAGAPKLRPYVFLCIPSRPRLSIGGVIRPAKGKPKSVAMPSARFQIGFAARLAALYAAMFVVSGIQLPFFPVWLKAKGLDPQMIGLVLAAPLLARVFAIPLIARAADRHDALRAAIALTAAGSVAGFLLVGLAGGPVAILVTYALASLALHAADAAVRDLRAQGPRPRAAAPMGRCGCGARPPSSSAHSRPALPTDMISARYLIWLIVAASLISALVGADAGAGAAGAAAGRAAGRAASLAARSRLRRRAGGGEPDPGEPRRLLRLLGAAMARARPRRHGDRRAVGARRDRRDRAVRAAGRLPPFVSPHGAADRRRGSAAPCAGRRWRSIRRLALLPVLQLLHAASFGATHLGTLGFLAAKAPPGQAASAQGHIAIAVGTTMAAATALSGVLYGAFGSLAYAAMALAAVAGGGAAYIANRAARRVVVV